MIQTKLWIYACAAICMLAVGFGYGHHVASVEAEAKAQKMALEQAATASQAWAERWTLQAQLATRDQQLAEAQAKAAQVRTVEVIKKEVVYRDRIKEVAVANCVRDSGLLQLYDATLGLSDPSE